MIFELPYEGREFTSPRPQATHIKGVEFYDWRTMFLLVGLALP